MLGGVIAVGINNRLWLLIADYGAYKTIMDLRMAEAFSLTERRAVNRDRGCYAILGSGLEHDHVGIVEDPFVLHLGERVVFTLTGMRVIEHPFPIFLLGADVMCGGHEGPSWNYEGLTICTEGKRVYRNVHFCSVKATESIPLV